MSSAAALILATQPKGGGDEMQLADAGNVRAIPFNTYSPTPVPVPSGNQQIQPSGNGTNNQFNNAVNRTDGRPVSEIVSEGTGNSSGVLPGTNDLIDPTKPPSINPWDIPPGSDPVTVTFPDGQGPSGRTGDPDPDPVSSPDGNREDDGGNRNAIVQITPSGGGTGNGGGGVSPGSEPAGNNAAEAETLIQVARQEFILKNYAKAADAYLKALAAGASPGSTYQRLAQCYEKLNRKEEAINAYELAITAYEDLGPENTRAKTAIAACRQALKILRSK